MLVLSRKSEEAITIGPDCRVVVVDIRGDKVRLGIVAPKNVAVHREEIAERIAGIAAQARCEGANDVSDTSPATIEVAASITEHGEELRLLA